MMRSSDAEESAASILATRDLLDRMRSATAFGAIHPATLPPPHHLDNTRFMGALRLALPTSRLPARMSGKVARD